jgi:hypothetical protein
MMTEDLTKKVVVWASEIAGYAAQLSSRQARDSYLAERHRELVAGAVAEGAAGVKGLELRNPCANHVFEISWRRERVRGVFDRTLSVPIQINPDAIKAEYGDGVLALLIPRTDSDKPRSIKIK